MKALRSFLVGILLPLCAASGAQAACNGFDLSKWTAQTAQEAGLCLADLSSGIGSCDSAICKSVREWRKPGDGRPPDVAMAPSLLARVRADMQPAIATFPEARVVDADMADFLLSFGQQTAPEFIANRRWSYDGAAGLLADGGGASVNLNAVLVKECAAGTPEAQCSEALRRAADVLIHTLQFQIVTTSLLNDQRAAFAQYMGELKGRWDSYFDKGRFQYPWELLINSKRYDRGGGGFAQPPDDQWILLHPSVGYRYLNGSGKKLEQTLLLEVAGYYRWEWAGAEATKLRGGSLVVSWADTATEFRRGIGFLVHMPKNYSLGLVQERGASGHKIALVMSLDLGKVVQDPKSQKASFLEAIR